MSKQPNPPSTAPAVTLGADESFRLLVDSVKDYAIVMLDPEGHVASWNAGAERIKGYTPEEIVGAHFSAFYPPEAIQRGLPEQELAAAAKDGRFEDEGWRVRKDGKRFWASVVFTALRDKDGALRGFGKVTRDLTERKQTEAKLKQKYDEIERFNRVTVGREMRMIELKKEINGLLKASGQPEKYKIVGEDK